MKYPIRLTLVAITAVYLLGGISHAQTKSAQSGLVGGTATAASLSVPSGPGAPLSEMWDISGQFLIFFAFAIPTGVVIFALATHRLEAHYALGLWSLAVFLLLTWLNVQLPFMPYEGPHTGLAIGLAQRVILISPGAFVGTILGACIGYFTANYYNERHR